MQTVKEVRICGASTYMSVGASIARPAIMDTKLHRKRRKFMISYENPNNCIAIVWRTANSRPYNINASLSFFDKLKSGSPNGLPDDVLLGGD